MGDLREYKFGDWFGISMKVVPALLIAQIVWCAIFALPFAIIWFLWSSPG